MLELTEPMAEEGEELLVLQDAPDSQGGFARIRVARSVPSQGKEALRPDLVDRGGHRVRSS